MDYYKIMEIPRDATQDEIEIAYKKLSKKLHPDKAGFIIRNDPSNHLLKPDELNQKIKDCQEAMEGPFKILQEAYTVLSDREKRKYYDIHGKVKKEPSDKDAVNAIFILLFRRVVSSIDSPKTAHVINEMISLITAELQLETDNRRSLLKSANKLILIKKRLSGPEINIGINILKADLQVIREDIKTIKDNIHLLKTLREMVDEYSYNVDEQSMEESFIERLNSVQLGGYPTSKYFNNF